MALIKESSERILVARDSGKMRVNCVTQMRNLLSQVNSNNLLDCPQLVVCRSLLKKCANCSLKPRPTSARFDSEIADGGPSY